MTALFIKDVRGVITSLICVLDSFGYYLQSDMARDSLLCRDVVHRLYGNVCIIKG